MGSADEYVKLFSAANFDQERLHQFATHLATFEAKTKFRPKDILINGIRPFPDILNATFEIPRDDVRLVIDFLLDNPLDTDIIINGKPADKFRQITVGLGR